MLFSTYGLFYHLFIPFFFVIHKLQIYTTLFISTQYKYIYIDYKLGAFTFKDVEYACILVYAYDGKINFDAFDRGMFIYDCIIFSSRTLITFASQFHLVSYKHYTGCRKSEAIPRHPVTIKYNM